MTRTRLRLRLLPLMLPAACIIALSPIAAAGQDVRPQSQAAPAKGTVVVEQVENGPVFGAEFKYAQIDHQDAFLLGGYGGIVFDDKLLVGGAGYWRVDNYFNDYYHGSYDYYGHHYADGYGGLLLEWFALRTPAVAVSARGLVGGGVSTITPGWAGDPYMNVPAGYHGPAYPPAGYYYQYEQAYFVFEPQANVTVRLAPGLSMAGGVGYRVIGCANGFEDQLQGLTATFAIRFGGK
jgi:hypothetical protein